MGNVWWKYEISDIVTQQMCIRNSSKSTNRAKNGRHESSGQKSPAPVLRKQSVDIYSFIYSKLHDHLTPAGTLKED